MRSDARRRSSERPRRPRSTSSWSSMDRANTRSARGSRSSITCSSRSPDMVRSTCALLPRAISKSIPTTPSRTSASRSARRFARRSDRRRESGAMDRSRCRWRRRRWKSHSTSPIDPTSCTGWSSRTLTEDFLYAFSQNAGIDLHVELAYGKNPHHVVEAVFKGLARALREAVGIDARVKGLPTVKGAL
jgi:hypothetical protein